MSLEEEEAAEEETVAAATAVATAPKPVAAAAPAKSAGSGAVSAFGVPVLTEDPKRHRGFKFPQHLDEAIDEWQEFYYESSLRARATRYRMSHRN